jgi:anhydro-N-acetylmuramic acid kinase
MNTRWIIGLASGSSADGVDATLLELNGVGLDLSVRPLGALHQAYPHDLRDLLLRQGMLQGSEVKQASLLHRLLGETFAASARQIADRVSFSLQRIQCIGCPGQTVWHEPEGRFPSSLSLGMAAVVAERTGVTTVSDFRSRDLAAGGQGAPLSALVDYVLCRHHQENRVLLHLGGIARVVFVPASSRIQDVLGFEAGPCNLLLDGLMRQATGGRETYDFGGKHAVQGRCIEPLLQRWLANPYFQRRPPKSLARHSFGGDFAVQAIQMAQQHHWPLHDVLCTATHFVARGIAQSVRRFLPAGRPPSCMLLSGGGVRNGLLWRLLEHQLADIPLKRTDSAGVPADVRKPIAYGVLAAFMMDGVPANLPAATGAAGSRLLGSLTPGSSTNWARCIAWMAAQTAPLNPLND